MEPYIRRLDDENFGSSANLCSKELWVLRFAANPTGDKMAMALTALDSQDMLDHACRGATVRSDRAPKRELQRILEQVIEAAGGGEN